MKHKISSFLFLLLTLFVCSYSFAQQKQVEGVVTGEDNQPLTGANIVEKGTQNGTITDGKGQFILHISQIPTILQVSFLGYKKKEVAFTGNSKLVHIILETNAVGLNEVVAVGYGTQKKSDLTGAIGSVKASELKQTPIANVVQGIQGRVSGVQVTQNSAAPGGSISMRIRGTNSINGTSEPLYIVDGIQLANSGGVNDVSSLSFLNPDDIASVEVLKDAAATAIYGSRGANGVVLITTKQGVSGKTQVSYDGYYGVQKITRRLNMMNAAEFAKLENDTYNTTLFEDPASLGEGTDWQNLIYRTAAIQSHQLTVSGGDVKTHFSLSGNYFDQQGIIIGSDFKRYSLRLNFDHQVSNLLKLGANIFTVYAIDNRIQTGSSSIDAGAVSTSIVGAALGAPPNLEPFRDDGSVYPFGDQAGGIYREEKNPMGFSKILDKNTTQRLMANLYAEFTITKGLTYRATFNPVISSGLNDYYSPRSIQNSSDLASGGGSAKKGNSNTVELLHESILTYQTKFGDNHSFKFTGVFATQADNNNSNNISASKFPNDATSDEALQLATDRTVSSSRSKERLDSYMGRINYSFKNKYLFDFTARYDGASKFGANHKYGFFPAAAVGWRISQEHFMENISFVSDLKIRGSYGLTGNAGAIGPYQSLATVASGGGYSFDHNYTIGISPSGIPNPDLRWEKSLQADIGLDAGLLDNRITFTVDVYNKKTKDLLFVKTLPFSSGYTSIAGNFASLLNRGFEFSANAIVMDNAFQWNISGNFSINQNKLLSLDGNLAEFPLTGYSVLKVGEPLGLFKTYVFDGIYQTGETVLPGSASRIGGVKVEDLNDDGQITADDQRIIGNAQPKFIYGFATSMSYKNFDFSTFFSGSQGNKIYNLIRYSFENAYGHRNVYKALVNRWSPTNPSNEYASGFQGGRIPLTDRFMEDGSFLRCKNITLGYTLKNIQGISSLRIYLSANNLFTITSYSGYDPEVNTFGNNNKLIGVDNLVYPTARSILGGVQLTF